MEEFMLTVSLAVYALFSERTASNLLCSAVDFGCAGSKECENVRTGNRLEEDVREARIADQRRSGQRGWMTVERASRRQGVEDGRE